MQILNSPIIILCLVLLLLLRNVYVAVITNADGVFYSLSRYFFFFYVCKIEMVFPQFQKS